MRVDGSMKREKAGYQSSVTLGRLPSRILRHLMYPDCFLIPIATRGCCFSDLTVGLLSQVRNRKALLVAETGEMTLRVFWRLSQMWNSSNHLVVWVFKLSHWNLIQFLLYIFFWSRGQTLAWCPQDQTDPIWQPQKVVQKWEIPTQLKKDQLEVQPCNYRMFL